MEPPLHLSPLHGALLPLVIERLYLAWLSRRNGRWAMEHGGYEIGADHYPALITLNLLWFIGMLMETQFLDRPINPFWPALLAIALLAVILRYWAIWIRGRYWNARLIIVPGAEPPAAGPWRWMKHPDYLAAILEVATVPLLFSAYLTALTTSLLFGAIMRMRIRRLGGVNVS